MCKNNYSFLIQNSFPNLVKLLNSKKIDYYLKITTYVQLIHFQFGPRLTQISVEFLIGWINELVVVEIWKKHLDSARKAQLEITEKRKRAYDGESLL